MLRQDMRRQLREHNWLDIANAASNPQQKLTRLRDEAIQALEDLVLLAKKLPDHKQKEIFNYPNIDKLLNAILSASPDSHGSIEDSARKAELASLLVKRGAEFCIQEYQSKIETNSILNNSNISKLKNSIDICDTIAFKMKLPEIQSMEGKEGLTFLFNWSKIEEILNKTPVSQVEGEDARKFLAFCESEFDTAIAVIERSVISRDPDKNVTYFKFIDPWEHFIMRGSIEIALHNTVARFHGYKAAWFHGDIEKVAEYLEYKKDEMTLKRDLVIKIQNNGDLYIYIDRSKGYTKVNYLENDM